MHSFFKSFVLESIFIGRLKKEEVIYLYPKKEIYSKYFRTSEMYISSFIYVTV